MTKALLTVLWLVPMAMETPVTAADAIPWQDAGGYVGEVRTVEGTVVAARREGNVLRLTFDADPEAFSVALLASLLSPLPADPTALYGGRTIRATGKIRSFRGISEMLIRDPSQIVVVTAEEEPTPARGMGIEDRLEELENRVEQLERRLKK